MPLRIAIDASRATAAQPTGTEAYALHLIRALIAANAGRSQPYHFQLYFRDDPPKDLFPSSPHVHEAVIPWPRMWTHLRLAAALWRYRPDITFVPAHTLPLCFPGVALVTVHDLGFKRYPEAHPTAQRAYLDITTRFSQRRASLVLADSQATAADLPRFYGTCPEKIRVVYPAVDAGALSATPTAVAQVRAKHQLPERYFLFLGTLQPRKNIRRIVEAFRHWQSERDDDSTALILAGNKGWLFDDEWLSSARNVRHLGYIDAADKGGLYAGALALVFPSLYEGFGFPVLEAMHCGAPVIASDGSSLPELVGEGGLLVNPLDVAGIADAMRRCSDDEQLRATLIARGYAQAAKFTWRAAAERVMAAFAEIAAQR